MKFFSVLPNYNRSQRIGILVLLLLILSTQTAYLYIQFTPNNKIDLHSEDIKVFQKQIDSLKLLAIAKRKPKIYPFNPSFITDYKAYKLGMSTTEIDRLLTFRKKGRYINSTEQFQQVTGVNDSLLATMAPYFKFPDWVIQKQKKIDSKHSSGTEGGKYTSAVYYGKKKDLNTATISDLIQVRGIGEKLATRIIKYRKKLGGYLLSKQLYEVWYLDKEVADKVLQRFSIQTKPTIEKININTASFKEVLHAPYMDYELTKKIFEYRDEMAEIQSMEELKKIEGFPIEKYDRISLYLKAE